MISIRQWALDIRVLAPCSSLEIRRMRPTALAFNPEVRMQARQRMRDVALIGASLCDRYIVWGNIATESDKVSPIRAT